MSHEGENHGADDAGGGCSSGGSGSTRTELADNSRGPGDDGKDGEADGCAPQSSDAVSVQAADVGKTLDIEAGSVTKAAEGLGQERADDLRSPPDFRESGLAAADSGKAGSFAAESPSNRGEVAREVVRCGVVEALLVLTKAGYDVALKPRPGTKDPDLAVLELCETLAKLYPDLEPAMLKSLARQAVPFVSGFGRRKNGA
jgi:hypothetical protein